MSEPTVKVWEPYVRVFHWSLVTCIATALPRRVSGALRVSVTTLSRRSKRTKSLMGQTPLLLEFDSTRRSAGGPEEAPPDAIQTA